MAYAFPADVKDLVDEQIESGQYGSEDEVLRDALRALAEEQEDLAAVNEAIAEWRAGDSGVPLDDAIAAIRAKHGIACK